MSEHVDDSVRAWRTSEFCDDCRDLREGDDGEPIKLCDACQAMVDTPRCPICRKSPQVHGCVPGKCGGVPSPLPEVGDVIGCLRCGKAYLYDSKFPCPACDGPDLRAAGMTEPQVAEYQRLRAEGQVALERKRRMGP